MVADCGLKALGMDHGDPSVQDAEVWFCSDEHLTFVPHRPGSTSVIGSASSRPTSTRPWRTTSICTSSTVTTWSIVGMWTCAAGERVIGLRPDKEVDMADTTFTIGAAAACSDGPCGAVSRVVVDPVARELTHLVIEPEHRSGLGRLVPLEHGRGERRRTSACATPSPSSSRSAPPRRPISCPGAAATDAYAAHEAYYWPYFGLEGGADPLVAMASAMVTRDMLPPGEIGVRRGEAVHASDGEIGKVEGLVVESAQGHVTHVLLQEGHLWGRKQVAIPIGAVEKMDGRHHRQPDQARDRGPPGRRRHRARPVAVSGAEGASGAAVLLHLGGVGEVAQVRIGDASNQIPARAWPSAPIQRVVRSPKTEPRTPPMRAPMGSTPQTTKRMVAFMRPRRRSGHRRWRKLTWFTL